MNAMAAVGTVRRAPEIVVVNDGKPVEHVGSTSFGARLAKIAVPAVAALAVGVAIGKIGTGASHYNAGLSGAKALLDDEKVLKRSLADVERVLDEHNDKNKFKPDADIDKALSGITRKLDVKRETYGLARDITTDGDIAAMTLAFYAGTAELKEMLEAHLKAAKSDDQAYATAKAAAAANQTPSGNWRYAVVVTAPASCGPDDKQDCNLPFGAQLVELGPALCGGKLSTSGEKCPDGSTANTFAYRGDPGNETFSTAQTKAMTTSGTDNVPSKTLLPLVNNGVVRGVLQGNESTASESLYAKRLKAISERTKKLIADANKLEAALQTQANKGSRFTFFL